MPKDYRREVDERLREWDKLSAQTQKELLEKEATLRYLTDLESAGIGTVVCNGHRKETGTTQLHFGVFIKESVELTHDREEGTGNKVRMQYHI